MTEFVRVVIFMTPPIASDPYNADCSPFKISILVTSEERRPAKSNSPVVGLFISTPSINTKTWFASEPLTRTCVKLPCGPEELTATPGIVRSKSEMYCCPRLIISVSVITIAGEVSLFLSMLPNLVPKTIISSLFLFKSCSI